MFAALVLTAGLLSAPGSADLSVDLVAQGTILFPGAVYDVKLTNNGPDPVTSATVVVTLDPRAYTGPSAAPCVYDNAADTLTCTAGPIPASGTATLRGYAYFIINNVQSSRVGATATRTASTPSDPNAANDSDTVWCDYDYQPFPPLPVYPPLTCPLTRR